MGDGGIAFETGHIGLNVTDIDRSTSFYQKVFGFEVLSESRDPQRRSVFLGLNGALLVTLWQQSQGRFASDHPGLHHLSFQVPDIEAVKQVEARLHELGATFAYDGIVPHNEHASSGGVFFEDPDGTRLEVYAPSGADIAPAPVSDALTCGFF